MFIAGNHLHIVRVVHPSVCLLHMNISEMHSLFHFTLEKILFKSVLFTVCIKQDYACISIFIFTVDFSV